MSADDARMTDPARLTPASTYDRVAEEYVRRIFHELDHKAFDRELLDQFADQVRTAGPVYDLGCGPEHVTRYLKERGVRVTGLDLSAAMVDQARRLNPDSEFVRGDMTALEVPTGTLAGIVDFSFFETAPIAAHLQRAGFEIVRAVERDPNPEVEYQSRRSYLLARAW